MENLKELHQRWDYLLRRKAMEYEHEARRVDKEVSSPSIDDICNEMDAFFAGLIKRK